MSPRRLGAVLCCATLLSGCVVGQHLRLDSTPVGMETAGAGRPVVVAVEDRRAAVISGKEHPWYVGRYRAGLGNPWDVTTEGKVPLALQLKTDLEEELLSLGFAQGPSGKTLQVMITEWDFTGYQNGRFWYRIEVTALDPSGRVAASAILGEEIPVRGTLLLGARGGFERDMPGIYARIVRSVVRDNPQILKSLSQ